MSRVLAQATVEMAKFGPFPTWDVTVWGLPPHDRTRTYVIVAKTDSLAAQDGIAQFTEEMECLESAEGSGE